MTYELRFREEAKREWDSLGATIRAQFKKKLAERLENPHVPSARLHGALNRYTLRRTDPRVGTVHVHFPRIGYVLRAVKS